MTGDAYFYGRAETELRMAQNSSDPAVIRVHYELANRYLDRFYNPDGIEEYGRSSAMQASEGFRPLQGSSAPLRSRST